MFLKEEQQARSAQTFPKLLHDYISKCFKIDSAISNLVDNDTCIASAIRPPGELD
jgi:hypothetical protein